MLVAWVTEIGISKKIIAKIYMHILCVRDCSAYKYLEIYTFLYNSHNNPIISFYRQGHGGKGRLSNSVESEAPWKGSL